MILRQPVAATSPDICRICRCWCEDDSHWISVQMVFEHFWTPLQALSPRSRKSGHNLIAWSMCDSSANRRWACSNLAVLSFKESGTKRCVVADRSDVMSDEGQILALPSAGKLRIRLTAMSWVACSRTDEPRWPENISPSPSAARAANHHSRAQDAVRPALTPKPALSLPREHRTRHARLRTLPTPALTPPLPRPLMRRPRHTRPPASPPAPAISTPLLRPLTHRHRRACCSATAHEAGAVPPLPSRCLPYPLRH